MSDQKRTRLSCLPVIHPEIEKTDLVRQAFERHALKEKKKLQGSGACDAADVNQNFKPKGKEENVLCRCIT